MTKPKKELPKQEVIKDVEKEIYDPNLTAIINQLNACKSDFDKINYLDTACLAIAFQTLAVQDHYVNTLCKIFPCLNKATFKKVIKELQKKEMESKQPTGNKDPFLKMVVDFLQENYDFRVNIISNKVEFKDLKSVLPVFKTMNDKECNDIINKLGFAGFDVKEQKLNQLIFSSLYPQFNPFSEYFTNLPNWDGVDYLGELLKCITIEEPELFRTHFEKHLVRSIRCALGLEFNKQCFVLLGGDKKEHNHNIGKTSFLRFLVPKELKDYYSEDLQKDKDQLLVLTENFFFNFDEIDGLGKQDAAVIKSLLSKDYVKVRLPFGKRSISMRRTVNFFGTSNQQKVLFDLSSSVRWLVFRIFAIDYVKYTSTINIDNVWAQMYSYYKNGINGESYKYNLSKEEVKQNEIHNERFTLFPPEYELIMQYFRHGDPMNTKAEFVTSTEIVKRLTDTVKGSIKLSPVAIGRALRSLEFEQIQRSNGKFQVRGYYIYDLIKYTETEIKDSFEKIIEPPLPF